MDDPSVSVWTADAASNLSRLDSSGAVQVDAEHPYRNRKVGEPDPASLRHRGGDRAAGAVWFAVAARLLASRGIWDGAGLAHAIHQAA
jgi:hypothetical protein